MFIGPQGEILYVIYKQIKISFTFISCNIKAMDTFIIIIIIIIII